MSWRLLPRNTLQDQKRIWIFPTKVVKGEHWKPAVGLLVVTAGLIALDPQDTPYFRRTQSFRDFNSVASSTNMGIGTVAVPLAFYALALRRKDSYGQHTALLAGEAVLDSEIITTALKTADGRRRPIEIQPNGNFSDTWFQGRGSVFGGRGCFPSGHTIAAFSIATVFADRYRNHHWVPWVAYGLAGLVGFSRITLQSHFPSDVFAGAALGYLVSHSVVLRNP